MCKEKTLKKQNQTRGKGCKLIPSSPSCDFALERQHLKKPRLKEREKIANATYVEELMKRKTRMVGKRGEASETSIDVIESTETDQVTD